MNRIVREHYPVAKLPEDLREGLGLTGEVRVVIEPWEEVGEPVSLDEIFAARKPPFRSAEEIDADLRALRDGWDRRG